MRETRTKKILALLIAQALLFTPVRPAIAGDYIHLSPESIFTDAAQERRHLQVLRELGYDLPEERVSDVGYDPNGMLTLSLQPRNGGHPITYKFANSRPFDLDGRIEDLMGLLREYPPVSISSTLPQADRVGLESKKLFHEDMRYLVFKRLVKYREAARPALDEIKKYLDHKKEPSQRVREEVMVALDMIEGLSIDGGIRRNIAFVTYEAAPLVKKGGLADVAGGLPRVLQNKRGHNAMVVMPYWDVIDENPDLDIQHLYDMGGPDETTLRIHKVEIDGTPIYLVQNDAHFGVEKEVEVDARRIKVAAHDIYRTDLDRIYSESRPNLTHPLNAETAIFFSRASLMLLEKMAKETGKRTDIINTADWQTGLIPALLKESPDFKNNPVFAKTRTVHTIHNLAHKGLFQAFPEATGWAHRLWRKMRLPDWIYQPPDQMGLEAWGKVSLMKAGIVFADAVTTVSPQYAMEIRTEKFGNGFEGLFRAVGYLRGILNGIARREWNPSTARDIPVRFEVDPKEADLRLGVVDAAMGKNLNKKAMKLQLGLKEEGGARVPVITFVGRFAEQKGLGLMLPAIEEILKKGKRTGKMPAQFVIIGSNDEKDHPYKKYVQRLVEEYPGHIRWTGWLKADKIRPILAGSDMLIMPSLYEPSGISDMQASRFGAIPIVSDVGGLLDKIKDFAFAREGGSGYVTPILGNKPSLSIGNLVATIERAVGDYQQEEGWNAKVRQVMLHSEGLSWEGPAREYEALYRELLGEVPLRFGTASLKRPFREEMMERMERRLKNLAYRWDPAMKRMRLAMLAFKSLLTTGSRSVTPDQVQVQHDAIIEEYEGYQDGDVRRTVAKKGLGLADDERIVYLSVETGLTHELPVYSGGLGVLSGDHTKAASDRWPKDTFLHIGLAYQRGYFEQYVEDDGQRQRYPRARLDKYTEMVKDPETGEDLLIKLPMPGGKTLYAKVRRVMAGTAEALLLDTHIVQNEGTDADREFISITDNLYVSDPAQRMRQEYLQGAGSMQLLKKLKIRPAVTHLNEGHNALAVFAMVKDEVEVRAAQYGYSLEELSALREDDRDRYEQIAPSITDMQSIQATVRRKVGFTSHTPVPAGNERFPVSWFRSYADAYFGPFGMSHLGEQLIGYGWEEGSHGDVDKFNFSTLAIAFSGYLNGVAQKNAEIANGMYDLSKHQTGAYRHSDFKGITNGVHRRFWQDPLMQTLLEESLNKLKRGGDIESLFTVDGHRLAKRIDDLTPEELRLVVDAIDDQELLQTKRAMKHQAIADLDRIMKRKRIVSGIENLRHDRKYSYIDLRDEQMQTYREYSLEELMSDPYIQGLIQMGNQRVMVNRIAKLRDQNILKVTYDDVEHLRYLPYEDFLEEPTVKGLIEEGRLLREEVRGVGLDPDAFHVVVARRFAEYKRSNFSLAIAPRVILQQMLQALEGREREWTPEIRDTIAAMQGEYNSTSRTPEHMKYNGKSTLQARTQILFDADKRMAEEQGWLKILEGRDDGRYDKLARDIERQSEHLTDMVLGLKRAIEEARLPGVEVPKIQIVFAGKAHPDDRKGQGIIERILSSRLSGFVSFVEDYDLESSPSLLKLADVWLNNPIPPKEASGTSGMKAAMNGTLNVSTPDGWVLEALQSTVFFNTLRDFYEVMTGEARIEEPVLEGAEHLPGALHECVDPYQGAHPNSFHRFWSTEEHPVCAKCGKEAVRKNPTHPKGLLAMFRSPRYDGMRAKLMKEAIFESTAHFNMGRVVAEYEREMYIPLAKKRLTRPPVDQGVADLLREVYPQMELSAFHHSKARLRILPEFRDVREVMVGQALEIRVEVDYDGMSPKNFTAPIVHFGLPNGEDWQDKAMLPTEEFSVRGNRIYKLHLPTDQAKEYQFTVRMTSSNPELARAIAVGDAIWMGGDDIKVRVKTWEDPIRAQDIMMQAA